MNACYIARRNALSASALERFQEFVAKFHELRDVFISLGVRGTMALPRQHALSHYALSIQLFGSPNGLCSSITESKHIPVIKKTWRRSNRFKALAQIVLTLLRLDKMAALFRSFTSQGMMRGTTASYMVGVMDDEDVLEDLMPHGSEACTGPEVDEDEIPLDDAYDEGALSLVTLCITTGVA